MVVIYDGLSLADAAKLFTDINTKQKPVSPALIADIRQLARMESGPEAALRILYDRLADDKRCPLYGRTSPDGSVRGKLSRAAFNVAMRPLVLNNILAAEKASVREAFIGGYFANAAAVIEGGADAVVRPAVFAALCAVMPIVITHACAAAGRSSPDRDSMFDELQKLARVSLKQDDRPLGKTALTDAFRAALMSGLALSSLGRDDAPEDDEPAEEASPDGDDSPTDQAYEEPEGVVATEEEDDEEDEDDADSETSEDLRYGGDVSRDEDVAQASAPDDVETVDASG